ncbi:hypothetical protein ACKGJY_03680 [Hyunsoonleella sp. 2307UL5-6]|uniref:hypothetical protein n=1 Tax=Hyunsoonleella sp. 2307UL5-6 TaxID=3384768 RepID=UPI0039BD3E13
MISTNFKIVLLILITTLINSCKSEYKIDFSEVYGKWTETEKSTGYTAKQIQNLTFEKDGKYQNVVINASSDSIVSSFNGTYELDTENNIIKFTNDGYVLKDMTLKKLTESEMIVEITEEFEGYALLYFSK